MSARFGFSGKYLEWKPRFLCDCTLFAKQSAIHFRPIATRVTEFAEIRVDFQDMEFHEIPSNVGRDTSVKVICCPSKFPLIIGRSQPNLASFLGNARRVQCVNFHENPRMEAEILPLWYFAFQAKCPSLESDRNQTDIVCRQCA